MKYPIKSPSQIPHETTMKSLEIRSKSPEIFIKSKEIRTLLVL